MLRELMISYALSFIGVPYKWAGNSPIDGMDCSGFVQECLMSVGLDEPGDQTAQGIYEAVSRKMTAPINSVPSRGDVIFFGRDIKNISHVAIALNRDLMIESGGGDSTTKTREDAIKRNAMVRIRPIDKREDYLCRVRIF